MQLNTICNAVILRFARFQLRHYCYSEHIFNIFRDGVIDFEKRNSFYQSKSHFVFAPMTFCHSGEKDESQQGFSYFSKSFSLSGIENHQKVSVLFRCFVVFVFSAFWKIKLPLSCKASFFTHSSSYSPASMLPVRNRILPRKNMLLQKFNILKNKTPFIKSKTKLPLSKNIT